eukprot:COSAG05_NODE_1648_length_4340_cov_79.370667_1_plen_82_part_00
MRVYLLLHDNSAEAGWACRNYSVREYETGTWEYAVVDKVAAAEGPDCTGTGNVWCAVAPFSPRYLFWVPLVHSWGIQVGYY